MSSVLDPSPSPPPVSTAQFRRMLEQALPSDAQLEAFCIDFAPSVHRQFSDGMERTRKLNLLLASTPPEELVEHLRAHAATLDERGFAAPARASPNRAGTQGRTRHVVGISPRVFGALAVAMGIAGLVLGLRLSRSRSAALGDAATGHEVSTLEQDKSEAADRAPWLTSDPPAALVYAVPSGSLLGQTPWTPDPAWPAAAALNRGLQVCLRSPGFVPMLVRQKPATPPARPRPIHVRLQREPRAGQKSDPRQEICNVPTPILE